VIYVRVPEPNPDVTCHVRTRTYVPTSGVSRLPSTLLLTGVFLIKGKVGSNPDTPDAHIQTAANKGDSASGFPARTLTPR